MCHRDMYHREARIQRADPNKNENQRKSSWIRIVESHSSAGDRGRTHMVQCENKKFEEMAKKKTLLT